MENVKRYRVFAFSADYTQRIAFIVASDEYKTAWQIARNDCRVGNTVEPFYDDDDATPAAERQTSLKIPAGTFTVRDVKSLERRTAKIPEPTYAEIVAYLERDDVKPLSNAAAKQLSDARDAIVAERVAERDAEKTA